MIYETKLLKNRREASDERTVELWDSLEQNQVNLWERLEKSEVVDKKC